MTKALILDVNNNGEHPFRAQLEMLGYMEAVIVSNVGKCWFEAYE